MKKSTRNGEIELCRGVFCLVVYLFHVSLDSSSPITLFPLGQIGVEFFFLLSGLFMASAAWKRREEDTRNLGQESLLYVIRKYISMFPYHAFAFIITFIMILIKKAPGFVEIIERCLVALPQFFLIHLSGMSESRVLSIEWYISSMLLAMLIIYPLLRKFYNIYIYVAGPLSALFILGYMYTNIGNLLHKYEWAGITTMAVWRAIAIMNLGCLAYEIGKYLQQKEWTKKQRVLLTVLCLFGYLMTIAFAQSDMSEKVRFTLVFLMMISVAISFSGVNLYGKYLDNNVCRFIGKISLPF